MLAATEFLCPRERRLSLNGATTIKEMPIDIGMQGHEKTAWMLRSLLA